MDSSRNRSPWAWVPTLYFAQGLPYVAVNLLSLTLYKNLGVSNTEIAFYTSWLNFPWVIKPLWSPLVDLWRTKRWWTTLMQWVMAVSFGLVALSIPAPWFFQATLLVFWLMAFCSATHDIAADGFYMLALDKPRQAAFVGVRSTAYRVAMIAGQGGLVYLAGYWYGTGGDYAAAWVKVFGVLGVVFLLAALYHQSQLPRPAADGVAESAGAEGSSTGEVLREWWIVMATFFQKPGILRILGFLLLYRFAEAQLLKLVTPFLLDERAVGGLGLTNEQIGVYYGTWGVVALTVGGLVGGWLVSRFGLRRMLWPLVAALHVPNAVFWLLAIYQPESAWLIGGGLVLEQLGYGLGFTAYLVYMMMVADGPHKTAHYALCTGCMALGVMLPGMFAGWVQAQLGYTQFFVWVLVCAVPSLGAVALAQGKIQDGFGRKVAE
ncbi:MFS transporter [Actomonas aquatica]|uniref:MFS transporter n=1 Tax=Actomonas aquatica TaxID=2866162 RepID=A0ABZ1C311_9BACT|nr:MFS transporter [Opitutus sp. WL0086]WRQ86084.1 MFS transporter [Opitutus sp. WL0086]